MEKYVKPQMKVKAVAVDKELLAASPGSDIQNPDPSNDETTVDGSAVLSKQYSCFWNDEEEQ